MVKNCIYVIVSIIMLACSNGDCDKELILAFSESEIISDCRGITKEIMIVANCQWMITKYPEWCNVNKIKKNAGEYLILTIHPNETHSEREGIITIESKGVFEHIQIFQNGAEEKELLLHIFPINEYSDIKCEKLFNRELLYSIMGNKIFINPHIREKIYHGNLINDESESIYDIIDYKQYCFSNITVSSFISGKLYDFKLDYPSKERTDSLAKEIVNKISFQNHSFQYNEEPITYNSYRELNLLGVGNLGLRFEELITGKSYLDFEMKRHRGLIYTYSHELFSMIMDYPNRLNNKEIESEKYYPCLSYISQINYGKTAFLIVETDSDVNIVNNAIKKIMQNSILKEEDNELLNNMDFYYLYFDNNNKIQTIKGGVELAFRYKDSIKDGKIIPLSFCLNKYSDYSISRWIFNLHLK